VCFIFWPEVWPGDRGAGLGLAACFRSLSSLSLPPDLRYFSWLIIGRQRCEADGLECSEERIGECERN